MRPRLATLAAVVLLCAAGEARAARVLVLDDGEKVPRDLARPLPPSAWPSGDVELFALRGETVAFQVVIEADDVPLRGVHAAVGSFDTAAGVRLDAGVDVGTERFIHIQRPSGSTREAGSLAFTPEAAPDPDAFVGHWADAIVPGDADVERGHRGAQWIDVYVPESALPGEYRSAVHVAHEGGVLVTLPVRLRVIDRSLPYAAQKTMVYYDPATLTKRMGDRSAEWELRALLHAHHLSAIREINEPSAMDLDLDALSGRAFSAERGYRGPGAGVGEGVFAIGAYGGLGEPSREKVATVAAFADALRARGVPADTEAFLYAIDETCDSPWAGGWRDVLGASPPVRDMRVGVTCGWDPLAHRASLVMMTPPDYHPARARLAKSAGKWVWAYNGRRPWSGPLMLDVPATDLRANAWIAARYGVDRWFYWESTYWLDNYGKGGRGGAVGFDPFEVAETFHNADGDYCNHDGVLVYPGRQAHAGMVDYGVSAIFPSVRLKNLRRGVQDVGYVSLARAVDPRATDEVVRRMIPRALAHAGRRASWPERGLAWLDARRDLARIASRPARDDAAPPPAGGCAAARPGHSVCEPEWRGVSACAVLALLFVVRSVRRGRR